jgi:hypothetical protein
MAEIAEGDFCLWLVPAVPPAVNPARSALLAGFVFSYGRKRGFCSL